MGSWTIACLSLEAPWKLDGEPEGKGPESGVEDRSHGWCLRESPCHDAFSPFWLLFFHQNMLPKKEQTSTSPTSLEALGQDAVGGALMDMSGLAGTREDAEC